jgi:hypothetical protein
MKKTEPEDSVVSEIRRHRNEDIKHLGGFGQYLEYCRAKVLADGVQLVSRPPADIQGKRLSVQTLCPKAPTHSRHRIAV